MPKTLLSLDERLNKFKITQERYLRESQLLRQAGFDEQQIERLILRKYSCPCVQKVLSEYQTLLEPPYRFTREKIVKIASHSGGSKNLAAVQKAYQALLELNFSAEQVVRMVSHDGGSKNLAAVQKAHQVLLELNFSAEQVVRMVSHDGGSKNLAAVQKAHQVLLELNFSAEQVVKMVSHIGGSKNLAAVQKAHQALFELNFSAEQVVRMVSHGGGSKNLAAVQETHQVLLELNFSAEQVVKIVSHDGGSKNLVAVQETYLALQKLGYSSQEIYQVSCHSSGSMNIRYLLLCSQRLDLIQSFNLTKNDLINILGRPCGHLLFKRACLYYEKLSSYGFGFKNIVSIVKSSKINAELLNRIIEKIHQRMNLDALIHCAAKKEFKTWLYEKLSLWIDEEYSYLKEIFSLEDDSSNLHEESEEFRELLVILQEPNDDEDTEDSDLGFLDGMIEQLETLIAPTNNFTRRRSLFSNKRSRDDGVTLELNKRLDCHP